MNETMIVVWTAAGLAAGGWHAAMLWRASHRLTAWSAAFGILRLGTVAAVLIAAALMGAILAAAGGWVVGFVACCGWCVVRQADRSVRCAPGRSSD